MSSRDKMILIKIITYCDEIEKTHAFFQQDKTLFYDKEKGFVYRNSITMPILQIGELAKRLSEEMRNHHDDIPWRAVMGMRDIFAHHYGALDYDIAWNTSVVEIPALQRKIQEIVNQDN